MNALSKLVPSLALVALCAGCVGTGPNTQQGAVTGGTLGAIAGAILGNNSRGHDTVGGAILGGVAGAIAGGTLGNAEDNREGTLYGPPQSRVVRSTVVAQTQQPPPAPPSSQPADVITAPPSPSAVWIPGYWAYNGYGYVWTAGRWEVPPPNCHAYVAPYWAYQGGSYVFVQGSWR